MLNLDRVRALCAVAQAGSVAAAGRILHVTPSGVSQQLAKLEREVGAVLLEPAGRGVRLTPAGELLARRGEELPSHASGIEAEIAAMRSEVVGPIRFGAFVTASRLVLPGAVTFLLSRYHVHVTVTEAETEVTLESVSRGRIDIGVVDSWESAPVEIPTELESRLIHRDTADVALPADHPFARSAVVPLSALSAMPWVAWGSGTAFHAWLVRTLRRQGFEPRVDFEASDISTHLAFAAAGLAAALVPRLAVDRPPAGVALVATEPRLHRDIYAVEAAFGSGEAQDSRSE